MKYRAHIYTRGQKAVLSALASLIAVAAIVACMQRAGVFSFMPDNGFTPAATDSLMTETIALFEAQIVDYETQRREDRISTRQDKQELYNKKKAYSRADTTYVQKERRYEQKYSQKEYFQFELNSADTTLLMQLPGIGTVRAYWIVSYRNRLGGYVSASQLTDGGMLPDSVLTPLLPYITIDTTLVKRININAVGVKQLNRHPYINYYQAKAIYNLRWDAEHNGILSLSDLSRIPLFTHKELERLRPYLQFSDKQ